MKQLSKERKTLYATGSDFCRIFRDDMQSLYVLALVLTADQEKAEQCFVAGLEDCTSGNQVFKEWARFWARRVVIKSAIRSIAPEITHESPAMASGVTESAGVHTASADLDLPAEISALAKLPARERFAFVLSFCEGYSDHECALLLGWTRERLVAARMTALKQLKDSSAIKSGLRDGTVKSTRGKRHNLIDLALLRRLATPA
jgi:DNA-directed RNA polymerase specialized sigma24 family protein